MEERKDVTPKENIQNELKETKIEKGLVLFHSDEGFISYNLLGDNVTLENLFFYRAYLDKIIEKMWSNIEV